MGTLLRNISSLFTFVLALVVGASAPAQMTYPDRPGPAKGGFDWTKFEGRYDFSECQSHPTAIWGNSLPGMFVQIDHVFDYARSPMTEGLELTRANNRSPLALGWSVAHVGHGRKTEPDADTGEVGKVMESYATADGVYGMLAWDRPHNAGWSTLQLRRDAQGNNTVTMHLRTDSDAITREEICTLKMHVPRIPI